MANFKETSNAKKGGLFVGKSHEDGGIPAIVTDTGQPIEVEGGEAIINKKATALHWEELSKINQSAGNGVPIPPPDDADKILEKYDNGGKITIKEKKVVYDKWKRLVNMTYTELSRYYHSKDGKTSGMTKDEADKQGISSGRESAEWILKMKKTSYKNWTDEMWKWANKQISFISRMSGVQGELTDDKGKKTPKYKALLIWGNNPKKKNATQFMAGGSTDKIPLSAYPKDIQLQYQKYLTEWNEQMADAFLERQETPDAYKDNRELFFQKMYLQLTTAKKRLSDETRNKGSEKYPVISFKIYKEELSKLGKITDAQIKHLLFDDKIKTIWQEQAYLMKLFSKQNKFMAGGSTSPEDAIKGLQALLWFSQGEERDEILAQIEALTSPAKQTQNPETNDVYPEDIDIVAVDKSIKELSKNYIHEIDEILGVSEMDDKRKAILKWIKEPKNNVRVIIAFSGGKDSVAMVLRCIYDFKIDKSQIELWHHEVDGAGDNLFDWQCTPSYCQAFADAMGVPLLFSYSGGGILREMYRENEYRQPMYFQNEAGGEFIKTEPRKLEKDILTRRMFPAVASDLQTRWCSSVAKIEVMSKAINRLPRFQNGNFVVMTGERRAESKNRAKYHEIEKYKTSETRQSLTWRCVIDLSDEEVWALYEKYKIQAHPCYELGWGRCSCQLCIFGTKNIWASINEISPEKINRIVEIEKDLEHSLYNEFEKVPFDPPYYFKTGKNIGEEKFRNGRKLDNVFDAKVSRGKSFIPKEALQRWGKEATGTFVSPIFVKEWKRPFGANSKEQSGAN